MVDRLGLIRRLFYSGEDILAYFLNPIVEGSAAKLPNIVVNLVRLGGAHA